MRSKVIPKFVSCSLMVCAVLALSVAGFGQSKKDIKKADQLVREGDRIFNQKNYRGAIEKYAEAIVLVPKNAKAHYWKGYAHYYLKENDQALSELNTALEQGFPALDVYKVRWYLNFDKQNYDAALEDIRAGLALEPNNLMFLVGLGQISYSKKMYPEALDAYQKALVVNPNNADLYYNIAQVQFNLGDSKGQAEAADAAIKHGTQHLGEAYYLLANGYQRQKRLAEAGDAYLRAINAKPDIYDAYRSLADIYRSEGRFGDAIDVSKRALRVFPNDGNIYTDLSWYYSLADRHEDAVEAAKAGTQLLPNQSLAYTNLCRAYNDTKQYTLAINACNNALRISPNDGETSFYLGRAYDLLGKSAEATRYYDQAVAGLVK